MNSDESEEVFSMPIHTRYRLARWRYGFDIGMPRMHLAGARGLDAGAQSIMSSPRRAATIVMIAGCVLNS